jgi:hypothetical protein
LGISALEANHNGDAILPSRHCAAVICIKVTVQLFRPGIIGLSPVREGLERHRTGFVSIIAV